MLFLCSFGLANIFEVPCWPTNFSDFKENQSPDAEDDLDKLGKYTAAGRN